MNLMNFCFSNICEYTVAATDTAAFIIGGYIWKGSESGLNIIAKFQDNEWTRYGSLERSRRLHGSIASGDYNMIIGGYSSS